MRTSQRGIELIKQYEGLELEAYQDIAGVLTIGYGHTGSDVRPGMRISKNDAEELLRRDLRPREFAVSQLAGVGLNQNEFDALISFIYNVGVRAFERSTARKRLNRGDRMGAADALTWFNKATIGGILREVGGLTRRRAAERALFLTPTRAPVVRDAKALNENSRITPVEDTPRRTNVLKSRTVQGSTVAGGAGVAASTMGDDSGVSAVEKMNDANVPIASTAPSDTSNADNPKIDNTEASADNSSANEAAVTANASDVTAIDNGESAKIEANAGGQQSETMTEEVAVPSETPTPEPSPQAEAQLQVALLVVAGLAVLFVIWARIDDWRNFRR